MTETSIQKFCVACKTIKNELKFAKDRSTKSGRRAYCKACDRAKRLSPPVAISGVTKRCSACKRIKPVDMFYVKRNRTNGRQGVCINCEFIRTRDRTASTKEPVRQQQCAECLEVKPANAFNRDGIKKSGLHGKCRDCMPHVKRQQSYGLTRESFEAMRRSQNNKCAVCASPLTDTPKTGMVIDHCHATGKVRGILCSYCNVAIAMVRDSPERAHNVWQYLLRHRQLTFSV